MVKSIPGIIPFPDGAESNPFFGALASALVPALGYTEETPFFCGQKNSYCIVCGNCKCSTLRKHRMLLYHDYQTFTGVSLSFVWPEEKSPYQTLPGWHEHWRWPDEFLGFIFAYAGLSWKKLPKETSKDDVIAAAMATIDNGIPLLMKPGEGQDWHVITGYDDAGVLYGLDGHRHPDLSPLPDWYSHFKNAVLITGRAPKTIGFPEILSRLIQVLEHPANARLESDLMTKLDAVKAENSLETAGWLLGIVGFPIEARWHAADSSLIRQTENPAAKEKIFGMIRQYVFDSELDATHGTCWKIWAQLGVGPKTNYQLPPDAEDRLLKPETQAELKRLFGIVFYNDRVVLELLREACGFL